jgi:hypothetical protein
MEMIGRFLRLPKRCSVCIATVYERWDFAICDSAVIDRRYRAVIFTRIVRAWL